MNTLSLMLSFLMIFTLVSCQQEVNLKQDKLLIETFSKCEIKGLELMVDFVDKMVLERTNETDINNAYHLVFEEMYRTLEDRGKFLIPFKEELKYEFLDKMDSSVFNAIWILSTSTTGARYKGVWYSNLENFKYLELRNHGPYVEYLKKLGQTDEFFKTLHKNISMAGGMPAGIAVLFPKDHDKFDFTIPKNRLWATIYILRIEEPFDMKFERYLNNKKSL